MTRYALDKKKEDLRRIIFNINELPSMPIVLDKILRAVTSEKSSACDLEQIMRNDQALTSRTLRLANSAFFGLRSEIRTVSRAVVIIGFNAVKNLAITASVINLFPANGKRSGLDVKEFWVHSMGVATASREIAMMVSGIDAEELFATGILHDLGKLILMSQFPGQYEDAIRLVEQKEITIRQAEEEIFGVDHTIVGFWLGTKWNLPEIFLDAIKQHHDPMKTSKWFTLSATVHVADYLCKCLQIGYSGDYLCRPIKKSLLERLGISNDQLSIIYERLNEQKDEIRALLEASS